MVSTLPQIYSYFNLFSKVFQDRCQTHQPRLVSLLPSCSNVFSVFVYIFAFFYFHSMFRQTTKFTWEVLFDLLIKTRFSLPAGIIFIYLFNIIIIIIIIIASFYYKFYLMVFHWSLSDSKSAQVSRTLLSILVDLNNAVAWIVLRFSTLPVSLPSLLGLFQADQLELVLPSGSWTIPFFSCPVRSKY